MGEWMEKRTEDEAVHLAVQQHYRAYHIDLLRSQSALTEFNLEFFLLTTEDDDVER